MQVIDWFYANKEWFFGGIGITVPLAVVSWLLTRKSNSQKQIQKSGKGSMNIQVAKNLNITHTRSKDKDGEE